jgi:general secretion pathway protein I
MRRAFRKPAPGPTTGEGGFVLIEAIVAFAVLAIGLGVLVSGIAAARRSDARIHARQLLERVAQSRLDAAGRTTELKVGRRHGRSGPYAWTETVTRVELSRRPQPVTPPNGRAVRPMWVEIVVRGDGGLEARLAALKLASGVVQ